MILPVDNHVLKYEDYVEATLIIPNNNKVNNISVTIVLIMNIGKFVGCGPENNLKIPLQDNLVSWLKQTYDVSLDKTAIMNYKYCYCYFATSSLFKPYLKLCNLDTPNLLAYLN